MRIVSACSCNPCPATRKAFAVVAYSFLGTQWPPVACEQDVVRYRCLMSKIHAITISELSAIRDGSAESNSWQPMFVEYVLQLARLFLSRSLFENKTTPDETADFLLFLLSSQLSELRLIGLNFLSRTLCTTNCIDDISYRGDETGVELLSSDDCVGCKKTELSLTEIMNTSSGDKLLCLLVNMATGNESNGECLTLVSYLCLINT